MMCVICKRGADRKRPMQKRIVDGESHDVCATCVRDCYSSTLEDKIRARLAERAT